ncbi:MAG TPA: hypothetical protein ENN19_18025 [Chloroflexi bacterium]|nr:hypothetical protein [Chloroflexota bacterium]
MWDGWPWRGGMGQAASTMRDRQDAGVPSIYPNLSRRYGSSIALYRVGYDTLGRWDGEARTY